MNPSALWLDLAQHHPNAAMLAIISSLPVRVSPAFLRLARLRLLEDCSTGNEADLWLSDLVEARSAAGFSYRSGVRNYLRERLAADADLLDRVWHEVHVGQAHWLSPKARLEEELTWRLLRDHQDAWIEALWHSVLQEMKQAENAEGVARWVLRAMPELPRQAFATEAANKVWIAANLMSGDVSVLGEAPQDFLDSGEFAFAIGRLPRQRIQVGLTKAGLLVSPLRRIENGHEVDLPLTRPLWLQIEQPDGASRQVLTLDGEAPVTRQSTEPVLNLRLLDGSVYRISDAQFRADDKFIRRDRAPRVQIDYDVERYDSVKKVQLPFVMGIMADLSGASPEGPPPLPDRKFVEIDRDIFEDRMQAMTRPLALRVPNTLAGSGELAVELHIKRLDDFSPQAVARQLFPSEPPGNRLYEQLDHILHHKGFQQLEGTWRGLHYLVDHTETNEMLKIRVLDISKKELAKTLVFYKGPTWDQSPIFKKLYEEPFGAPGGEPFGCLVGDYYFDHSPQDVELLGGMARICAAMHAPFLTGTAPSMLQMEAWNQLRRPRELEKITMPPEYAAFRSLRDTEDARYLAMTLPRFLSRLPYGSETNPVEGFSFEEGTDQDNADTFTWSNSAYLMATNINRAFTRYGWCARIQGVESGGTLDGLSVYAFPADDGRVESKCPTEIAISDRREAELAKLGFLPLLHRENSNTAAYIRAQSLHKPARYDMPEATANAALAAQLPYLFAMSRFAHYVKCIGRDKIGSFDDVAELERWLNAWIQQYVDARPAASTETDRARHPLADAKVILERPDDSSGYVDAQLYLRPHYQLEGLTTALRITTRFGFSPA